MKGSRAFVCCFAPGFLRALSRCFLLRVVLNTLRLARRGGSRARRRSQSSQCPETSPRTLLSQPTTTHKRQTTHQPPKHHEDRRCPSVAGLLGAQAFVAPAPRVRPLPRRGQMSFEDEAGVTAPLGFWVRALLPAAVLAVGFGWARPPPPLGRGVAWAGEASERRIAGLKAGHRMDLTRTPLKQPPQPTGPLGFSADGDVDKFNRYRAIEIKHGRGTSWYWIDWLAGWGLPASWAPSWLARSLAAASPPGAALLDCKLKQRPPTPHTPQWPCLPCFTRS